MQTVGATTEKLSHKQQGEFIQDFVGPLGRPTETEGKKKVCVVGGETKFACVDGPDFDGHKVDWDESLKRGKMYFDWERHKHEEVCNLFKKEVQ